ncbi:VOC family protein [Streptomyces cavernicola]|uniref:VOC family protein n=1 Tax=Streptomyces cavernicola TaxID=3043613 RepID=A0ABT6S4N2_9ACTN|nr:VOC family protein [Streptomyces sp. B-S-A6]MDI3402251.1 VOC family protein [Streptomyces sp. B-S-A6]
MTTSTSTPTPRFDLIGLVVSDMAASVAFYRRLGLAFPEGAEQAPHVEAALPGGLRFALDTEATVRSFAPDWRPPVSAGRAGLAFLCADPAAVDSTYEELVDAGYDGALKPFDAFWGQRYATVLDPDGQSVDLFAPLPGAVTDGG